MRKRKKEEHFKERGAEEPSASSSRDHVQKSELEKSAEMSEPENLIRQRGKSALRFSTVGGPTKNFSTRRKRPFKDGPDRGGILLKSISRTFPKKRNCHAPGAKSGQEKGKRTRETSSRSNDVSRNRIMK